MRIRISVLLVSILAFWWFIACARADESSAVDPRIAAVENGLNPKKGEATGVSIADRMRALHVPGASVAVIHDYKIAWAKGYGVVDSRTGEPVTVHTLFQAASTSKPVAAMGALKLVEEGLLDLDEDVNRRLKTWKVPANEFTRQHPVDLRSLLSHTAGTTVHGFGGYKAGHRLPTLQQILDGAKPANSRPIRVDKVPGQGMRYSGGGTLIAQKLMMDVTNKPFPALMRELVFTPLGMSSSTFQQPLPMNLRSKAASGHSQNGEVLAGKWHVYPELSPAGLWTTPSDMARYVIEVQLAHAGKSEKVLSSKMVNEMLKRQNGGRAGLGPFPSGEGEGRRFGHNGANAGFRCEFVGLLHKGDGAVVMTNSDSASPLLNEIVKSIARAYVWTQDDL